MAQLVHVKVQFEPGEGLPGSVPEQTSITEDGIVEARIQVPLDTGDAIMEFLHRARESGYRFDGPLTITAEKVRQIGGSDGSAMVVDEAGNFRFRR